ncbi:MAG: hypothetical protein G01um101466_136 [Parcubacteria group bacterium Gr01-1014_66]|nr:MAG: hypothetical protein G01um101466_136 [Parcubacteria group bacterium Gr01-1014_66]
MRFIPLLRVSIFILRTKFPSAILFIMNQYTSIWNQHSSLHFLIFLVFVAAITIFLVNKAQEIIAEIEVMDAELQQRNIMIKRAEHKIDPGMPSQSRTPVRLK